MEDNKITMAALGAKLDYLKTLRGECPEGFEIEKHLAGGCVKCRKKAMAKTTDIFKDKCGSKVKKRVKKKNMGGEVDTSKIFKNQKGGPVKKDTTVTNKQYQKMPLSKKVDVDLKDQAKGTNKGEGGTYAKKRINLKK